MARRKKIANETTQVAQLNIENHSFDISARFSKHSEQSEQF